MNNLKPRKHFGWLITTGMLLLGSLLEIAQAGPSLFEDPQQMALEELRGASIIPVSVRFEQGFPRTLSFDVPTKSVNPINAARSFVYNYEDLFRQGGAKTGGGPDTTQKSELWVRGVFKEGEDKVVAFYQTLGGVPVFGANLMVHISKDSLDRPHIRMASGVLLHSQFLDLVPAISLEKAVEKARGMLPGDSGVTATLVGDIQLMVYDPLVAGEPTDPRLVWAVILAGKSPVQFLIDAHTTEVLLQNSFGLESDGLDDYDLYFQDAHGGNISDTNCFNPTTLDEYIGDEDGIIAKYANLTEAVLMWWHWRNTYLFYHNTYGRHSFDDDDEEIEAYIYSNAEGGASFISSCGFQFAPGWVSFDVAIHEFTHGVVWSSSQLVYSDQSGALNESFSDVMATVADSDDWLIAEDLTGGMGAIRNLADPFNGNCGRPDSPRSCGQPDRMSEYCFNDTKCKYTEDNNGVHTNSGIPNKAHYLMAEGGEFNGVSVSGMGRSKMGRLAYTVLQFLPKLATFTDARTTGIALAQIFAAQGRYGFTGQDICTVRNAWAAVEIGDGDLDCDGIENNSDDADNDGILEPDDNCPEVANPIQFDSDHDGIGDVCDEDVDGDSCPNFKDNCPGFFSPCTGMYLGSPDTDGDGQGDACDDDDDQDGIPDGSDNCPWNANADQFDGNANGQGDACDPDIDGDGFYVERDNCTLIHNPSQVDSDGDGLGDACDRVRRSRTTPRLHHGLPRTWRASDTAAARQ